MDLTAQELRVLGCLIEKQRTVPDTYPLSLNALRSACNQMTNREPVVSYDERTIEAALDRLRERHLIRRGVTSGSRVIKYWQLFDEELGLDGAETALLCVLALRGPQTAGELKARTERLHGFESLDALVSTLDRLAVREEPLVARLAREPGRKEARYVQLLGDGGDDRADGRAAGAEAAGGAATVPDGADRLDGPGARGGLDEVRAELASLRAEVEQLRDRLDQLGG